ncbi:MAG TPA: type II toxin-antitoxin system VapC family toxin [Humisphaera sp.]|nr:type II toxin-antitoxin system VapC family toxin [Humisphaera sp.]
MIVLLDTCALIWWAVDPQKLSRTASDWCARMEAEGGAISSISIWEIGTKIKKGKLDIGLTIEEFTARIRQTGAIDILPVDEKIWIASLALQWPHTDPVDRVIVATAALRALPLLTTDREIHSFYPKTVW